MVDDNEILRQLRALGDSLQAQTGEPITASSATGAVTSLSSHQSRRRWTIMAAAAAACVVAVVGGLVALTNGDTDTLTTVDSSVPSAIVPPETVPTTSPPPTTSSQPVAAETTASPAPSVAPIVAAPMEIAGRALQLDRCPVLDLTGLPEGWDDAFEPVSRADSTVRMARLMAPTGQLTVSVADNFSGQTFEIDGYTATVRGDTRSIGVGAVDCRVLDLTFDGVSESDVATALEMIDIDDSVLTDVAAGIQLSGAPSGGRLLFGRELISRLDADPFVDAVSAVYGPTDSDTGWLPMPDDWFCTGAAEYRSAFWGDLRVVFERRDQSEHLGAWSVGDPDLSLLAPTDAYVPTRSIDLRSAEGLAVGAPVSVLDQFPMVGDSGGGRFEVAGALVVSVNSVDGLITGFGTGRNDC